MSRIPHLRAGVWVGAARYCLARTHWPFRKRIDPVHAWGLVALGTAFIIGIPPMLSGEPHFRWWWPTNWMAFPVAVLMTGLLLVLVPVRGDVRQSLVRVLPGTQQEESRPALVVTILDDSQFENWHYIALIASLHVQIENTTDRAILVAGYGFTYGNEGWGFWDYDATIEQGQSVRQELYRREQAQEPGPLLRYHARIPARATVSGWLLTAVTRRPSGGIPECVITVRHDTGNCYTATRPKQEPQTYGSQTVE